MSSTNIEIEVGESLGSIIKKLRKERGWSLSQTYEKTKMKQTTYLSFERGKEPKLSNERKILDAFGIAKVENLRRSDLRPVIIWKGAAPSSGADTQE